MGASMEKLKIIKCKKCGTEIFEKYGCPLCEEI
jgi:uncharacterized Zn finger protein (UPF0148 family)